ncbi:hypothetical protein [Candidatus Vidania fulgoroideorum]
MNVLRKKIFSRKKKIFGSKSITNRYLFFSFFFNKIKIKNPLVSNDTKKMLKVLKFFGYKKFFQKNTIIISFKKEKKRKYINIENAGTVARPIFAFLIIKSKKRIVLDGNKNMRKRPLKGILKILNIMGNFKDRFFYLGRKYYLPINFKKGKMKFKRKFSFIKEKKSSQIITSLLLNSCLIKKKIFYFIKHVISYNYVLLTLNLMKKINLKFLLIKKNIIYYNDFRKFKNNTYLVNKDIISASYYLIDTYFSKKKVSIRNLKKIKGVNEYCLLNLLKKIGFYIYIKKKIKCIYYNKNIHFLKVDCKKIIDFSMCLPVLISKKIKKMFLYNIYNWKYKECNRIKAIAKEIKKMGHKVYYGVNFIIIFYNKIRKKIIFDSYNDHRIAMLVNCYINKYNGYIIKPNCVKKTFPKYYDK